MSRCAAALLTTIALVAALAGCDRARSARHPALPGSPSPAASPSADPSARAAAIAARLGDEDLVGQVLMPYAYGDSATKVSPASRAGNQKLAGVDTPAEMIRKYRLGGLILVSFSADDPTSGTNPTTNMESPTQVHALTAGLQSAAKALPAGAPLLIGTDQEYGVVTRIRSGVTQLPSAMAVGAAGDAELTRRAWAAAGADLAALGINVDFAPDADVVGGAGGVIGSRSFGADPAAVGTQVAAAVRGLQSAGVAATLKHFPGHGHTTTDSHTSLPVLSQDRATLDSGDLPPFRAGIGAGADMIMVGHLDVRAIDPGIPATFSRKVLTDVLRGQLGFQGVVVTDALNMAPAERWSPGEAAVRALLAGNDLLLMPPNVGAARQGILDALHTGRLPRQRLVDSVTRILALKLRITGGPGDMSTVDSSERRAAAQAVTAAAVTVLRGACSGALVHGPVSVTASNGRDQQRRWLTDALRAAGVEVTATGGTQVHLVGYGDGTGDLSGSATVTVGMDTPYLLASSRSPTLLATYSSTQAAMTALARVLAGAARAPGRSPVPVRGLPRSACG
ncbi:MAG TPA: glycoside hydrolase family 3 N-terminal domain-containing protein [Micromonosporaceae bacterium]